MPDAEQLTQKETAKRLGISPRQLRNLDEHGCPRLGNKKYPWPEVRDWYIKFKQQERERRYGRGDLKLDEERARKTAIQADREAIKLARERGELIPVAMHEERCAKFAKEANAVIRAIPGRWPADLAHCETVAELQATLKRLVNDLLEELANGGDGDAPSG